MARLLCFVTHGGREYEHILIDLNVNERGKFCMATPIVGCPELSSSGAESYANRWFLIDEQNQWVTDDSLKTVEMRLQHGMLVLRAPGMLRLDIPLDVIEDDDSVRMDVQVGSQVVDVVDEGDLPAAWFSNLTGQSCRLVKVHPEASIPSF